MTINIFRIGSWTSVTRKAGLAICFSAIAVLVSSGASTAMLPTDHTEGSRVRVDYSDWNRILKSVVMVTGSSDRKPAGKVSITASRIPHANPNITRIEGNRVFFHEFSPAHTATLLALRRSLEAVSAEISLSELSRNQQLAYWLNLHNVAVMTVIAQRYPVKYLKKLIVGEKAVWNKKSMLVAGEYISIRDIEKHVIENWNDPLVLYGFYMGAVGGPNVLDSAFTGNNVRDLLIENAEEFVNSLRGVRFWDEQAKVSNLYGIGARFFPSFDEDIKKHLMKFARPSLKHELANYTAFRISDFDWYIADLLNGDTYTGSSYSVKTVWVPEVGTDGINSGGHSAGSDAAYLHMPPHVRDLLIGIKKRNLRRYGRVSIEKVDHGTTPTDKKPEQP